MHETITKALPDEVKYLLICSNRSGFAKCVRHSGRDPESPPDILWLILNGDANPERLPAETDTPIVHTQKNKYD